VYVKNYYDWGAWTSGPPLDPHGTVYRLGGDITVPSGYMLGFATHF